MTSQQYLLPGGAFFNEATNSEFLVPGGPLVQELGASTNVTGTIGMTLSLFSQQMRGPPGGQPQIIMLGF